MTTRIGPIFGVLVLSLVACSALKNRERSKDGKDRSGAADKHYDVAVGSFHNGMFEDAKRQLERALTVDPEHADSHYLRGVLYLTKGKSIVDAIEIEQCLNDDAAIQQRVKAERLHRDAAGAFERAVQHYEEGAAGRGRALNSLSVVALFFHDNAGAISRAKAALEEQYYSHRYSALTNLGWAYYREGDLVSATAELRQAVLINPDYCVGHYRLAQVYLDGGRVGLALEQAKAVIDNERCPIQDAHRIAGVAHLRMGQDPDAGAALGHCVSLAPRSCLAEQCRALLGPDAPPAEAPDQAAETTVAQH